VLCQACVRAGEESKSYLMEIVKIKRRLYSCRWSHGVWSCWDNKGSCLRWVFDDSLGSSCKAIKEQLKSGVHGGSNMNGFLDRIFTKVELVRICVKYYVRVWLS